MRMRATSRRRLLLLRSVARNERRTFIGLSGAVALRRAPHDLENWWDECCCHGEGPWQPQAVKQNPRFWPSSTDPMRSFPLAKRGCIEGAACTTTVLECEPATPAGSARPK